MELSNELSASSGGSSVGIPRDHEAKGLLHLKQIARHRNRHQHNGWLQGEHRCDVVLMRAILGAHHTLCKTAYRVERWGCEKNRRRQFGDYKFAMDQRKKLEMVGANPRVDMAPLLDFSSCAYCTYSRLVFFPKFRN
jgi:hypothetical protein